MYQSNQKNIPLRDLKLKIYVFIQKSKNDEM